MDTAVAEVEVKDTPKYFVDPALMPDIESLIIEDDEPVDNLFQDSQRRLLVNGQSVFTTCSCKALGPPVTIGALVASAVLLLAGVWWTWRRK